MPTASRSGLPSSLRTAGSRFGFSSVTRFLQQDADSPDTRALRAGLLALSGLVEQTTQVRREHQPLDAIERQAAQLSRQARQHQLLLTGMDSAWHDLYEFGAYQQAVYALRQALERWRRALREHAGGEPQCFADFERLAWRTLGEALLVLDLYEQQGGDAPRSAAPARRREPLLRRLRAWLARRPV
ncbi:hypothetical protein [Melaminivora suipulveris]|uniref:hypothetical protein n=1 Tax=Melaminivora suipulveris TaxID=2109913 RepID=UPI00131A513F|nr:hypothetical protein [Melaminivora suipulveris]